MPWSDLRRGVTTLWDQWPSVSIIVPAHNAEAGIAACVRSIQLTRYERWELVLVDDGSTDTTAELMAALAAADPRIKVVRQARAGRAAALNLGSHHSAGDVLIFRGPGGYCFPADRGPAPSGFRGRRHGSRRRR